MFEMLVDNTVKENNKREWQRINNIWLEVKNNNKSRNPELYDTESDDSCDYESTNKPQKELKRADSSYDELLHAHDCIITEKNEIECTTPNIYDGIEDSKTHFTSSSSSCGGSNDNDNYNEHEHETENVYRITMYEIKNKYKIENSYMLEIDYSMNYNMKMLTHIASYYNIIKNNKNGLGIVAVTVAVSGLKAAKPLKTTKTPKTKKLLKPELIKEIISFETDESNHHIVLKFRKMLEKIDELKQDKYFSSFILFS
jgi:hypothetical protein